MVPWPGDCYPLCSHMAGLCSAGYYCEGGATDAIPRGTPGFPLSGPCPLGHYCPEGTHFPVACPVGTLNNATGECDFTHRFLLWSTVMGNFTAGSCGEWVPLGP